MRVLGISAFYHDSAAALVVDGSIIAAAQEERFTRRKHDAAFPTNAINYCLKTSGIPLEKIDYIVFYDKPFLKFERLLETYLAFAPKGFRSFQMAIPLWIREKLFHKRLLREELQQYSKGYDWDKRLLFAEHHLSHAASAFYPSPFHEAAVITMDGVGEWATTSISVGQGNRLEIINEIHFPHSLGFLYSAVTYYTGFKVNSGEYKVMGLAPYGEPKYKQQILDHLIDLKEDGSFRLDQSYFNYCTGLTMTNEKFHHLFGRPPRKAEDRLDQFHMDMAASVQAVTEEAVLRMTRYVARETGMKNLCLAGGVALNCVANGKIKRDGRFNNVWIQPAAGDAGGALGAALSAYYLFECKQRDPDPRDSMQGAFLGPEFSQAEIEQRLKQCGARFKVLCNQSVINTAVEAIAEERVVGWFQGRMEFGPRALGSRSILGDPRSPRMQKTMNLKIKYRESFRPFAPAVLNEDLSNWFEWAGESPYMLFVGNVKKERCRVMTEAEQGLFGIEKLNVAKSDIPAVTHVDYSARIQTVHKEINPRFHQVLSRFKEVTGCPVLVNTSFNVRGEPIVCTPEDAFRCFMGTEMDALAIGNCFLRKDEQKPDLCLDYKNAFELD
jgi:carbamoyltransferase